MKRLLTLAVGTARADSGAVIGAEALVFSGVGRPFERISVPAMQLLPGEALVEVELTMICGSDVHTFVGARPAPVPLVLGHEQVGHIVAVADERPPRDVAGHLLAVGDRVVWGVAVHCGRCRYCHAGYPQKCISLRKYGHDRVRRGWELSGGCATHVHLLAHTHVVKVSPDLPAGVIAAASCATATVAAALEAAATIRPLAGAVVLVSGAGMLGITAVAMAREAGATVIAVDPDRARQALAERFGARAVSDGTAAGLMAALRRIPAARSGPAIAIEVSGSSAAAAALIPVVDIGGVIVLAGSVSTVPPVSFDPELLVRRLLTLRGVHNYASRHLQRAVEFLTATTLPFAELVGTEFPLADAEEAFRTAARGGAPRVALRP